MNCAVCDKPDCDDWMLKAGLVKDKPICGECKVRLADELKERMMNSLAGRLFK